MDTLGELADLFSIEEVKAISRYGDTTGRLSNAEELFDALFDRRLAPLRDDSRLTRVLGSDPRICRLNVRETGLATLCDEAPEATSRPNGQQ